MGTDGGTSVAIRQGTEADVNAGLDLLSAVASEGQWIATEEVDRDARRARFLENLRREDQASFVALVGDQLVGTLYVELRSGDGRLGMFVAADHRDRGIGSALMEAAIGWAKQVGAHRLSLTVFPHNHAARALYAKFGFKTEGTLNRAIRRRNGELWDAIVMGLVLDTQAPGAALRPSLPSLDGGLGAGDLVLRPGWVANPEALVAAIDDPEIHRRLPAIPDPFTLEDALGFLAETRRQWTDAEGTHFIIAEGEMLLGMIGLSFDARVPRLAEASYWLARQARGRGVTTVALRALVGWAFETLGLRRIEVHAAVDNMPSRKVAEGAGFQLEGVMRSRGRLGGVPTDFALYAWVAEQLQ
jgi:RimJ/RimL family protein N-acetyltransferase